MSDAMNSHATAIKQAARELAQGSIWFTGWYIETIGCHADTLARELDEARELANTYSAALSMVEDCLADAAGDDTSINDIRQSLGLPARDDMLPAPGDTDNQEAHPMDTLNDHAARISARIEEYRTLDLIGRNSADDLQHHLRALVAERDEARRDRDAREEAFDMCARSVLPYQEYIEELESKRAEANALLQRAHDAMMDWHFAHGNTSFRMDDEEREMGAVCRAIQDYRNGDIDDAPGDPAGER